MSYTYRQLIDSEVPLFKELLLVFGRAFEDLSSYQHAVPTDDYLQNFLSKSHVIALVAMHDDKVVGGLVAYELEKFEQDRRELYIYDLAVLEEHRRKGLATGLIQSLKGIAKDRKAYVIFVQADKEDLPAIALYKSLGTQEDVYHFDIDPS